MNQTLLAMRLRTKIFFASVGILLALAAFFVPTIKITLEESFLKEDDLYVYASPFALLTEQEVQVRTVYDAELEELGLSKKEIRELLGKTTVTLPEENATSRNTALLILLPVLIMILFFGYSAVRADMDMRNNRLTKQTYSVVSMVKKANKLEERDAQAVCCAYAKLMPVWVSLLQGPTMIVSLVAYGLALNQYSSVALKTVNGVYDVSRAIGFFTGPVVICVLMVTVAILETAWSRKVYQTLAQMQREGEL